jgi:hypothetical protein
MPDLSLLVPHLRRLNYLSDGRRVDLVACSRIRRPVLELNDPPFRERFLNQDAAGLFWGKLNSDRLNRFQCCPLRRVDQICQQG